MHDSYYTVNDFSLLESIVKRRKYILATVISRNISEWRNLIQKMDQKAIYSS